MPYKLLRTTHKSHVFYVKNRKLTGESLESVPAKLDIISESSGKNERSYVIHNGIRRRIQDRTNAKKRLDKYNQLKIKKRKKLSTIPPEDCKIQQVTKLPELPKVTPIHEESQILKPTLKRKKQEDEKNLTSDNSHAFYIKNRQVGQPIETVPANLDITTEYTSKGYESSFVIYQGEKRRIQAINNARKSVQYAQLTAQIKNPTFFKKHKKQEHTNQTPCTLIPSLSAVPAIVVAERKQTVCEQKQSPMSQADVNLSRLDNFYVPLNNKFSPYWGFGLFDDSRVKEVLQLQPHSLRKNIPNN